MRDVGWMSGWEFTLIQALDTGERWCPEGTKEPRNHVSSSVSWEVPCFRIPWENC